MSIKGFSVGGVVQRYDYTALDNLPQGQGVSDNLKAALLQLAQKAAYIDDQGQTYYDDLYNALYPEKTLLSITANFQQGQAVVYNTDSLDSLKQYLTVTAVYDDASTATVASSAYTLSGTLTAGTSVITVTYEGKTDAFNVTVTAAPMSFAVTNNLTGCTTSNSAMSVLQNSSYTAVITASSGYTLVGATVSITMGGNDITTSAYSGGIITINSVTGALVISATAVAVVLSSISAVYTQSGTVYDTDTLDSLKADLVVTARYSDSSTQTVPAADYTLSGTLTEGTSTITVSYGGKTTTFSVTVAKGQLVPSEYQQVEYLTANPTGASGDGYINLGTFTNPEVGVYHIGLQAEEGRTGSLYPIGTRQTNTGSTNNTGFALSLNYGNKTLNAFSGSPGAVLTVDDISKRYDLELTCTSTGLSITDGENTANSEQEARSYANMPICLFALRKANISQVTGAFKGKIFYAQVFENGSKIIDAIPVYRKSDNAVGVYDRVAETFVAVTGSATITAGPAV